MGMHVGLVAVKGAIGDLKASFPRIWPTFEITASADHLMSQDAIFAWMTEHERFVSAGNSSKENPATQCSCLTQAGPWAILMDPSYVLASDEEALKQLSADFGLALSFVVETAGGCAYFSCFEAGQLKRSIINNGDGAEVEGASLTEERGIHVDDFYMEEAEALMAAFGLPALEDLPIPGHTITIALTDRTDDTETRTQRGDTSSPSRATGASPPPQPAEPQRATKPWWKLW